MTTTRMILATAITAIVAVAATAPLCAAELEEERPYVGSIKFIGNENVGDGELKRVMRTRERGFFQLFNRPRFRPDFLRYDLAAIEALYHKKGYYEVVARVLENRHDESSNENHIVIGITEGQQTIVEEVNVKGELPFEVDKITKNLKLKGGAPFDSTLIGSDIYYIRNRLWDEGRVLAVISSTVELEDHRAHLTYTVDQGPPMRIGVIEVRGNRVAEEKRIRQRLTFDSGEVFSLKKILESQQHLFDTSLFRQVNLSVSGIDTLGREVDLLVEVEERKMSYLELGIGIGTEDNGRIAAEWGHRHLPGLRGKLQVEGEYAFDVVREGKAGLVTRFTRSRISYTGPRFPGTHFQTAVSAFYEIDRKPKTVDYDVWGFGVHGRRRMGVYTVLYLDFNDEFVRREIPPLQDQNPFTRRSDETRVIGLTLDRDARDDLLYPSSGSHRSLRFEVAGGPLRADNYFVKAVGSLSFYTRSWLGMTLSARARAGIGIPYGKSDDGVDPDGVPYEDRFYAGGSNSVRGYGENSLGPRLAVGDPDSLLKTAALRGDAQGGEVLLLTNVELRFPLIKRIKVGGVLFLDGGNVWDKPSSISLSDFVPKRDMGEEGGYTGENLTKYRYSFGVGIRYNTPIGPLRVDFGVPVSRTGEIRSFGMFHFNLGQTF